MLRFMWGQSAALNFHSAGGLLEEWGIPTLFVVKGETWPVLTDMLPRFTLTLNERLFTYIGRVVC